MRLRDLTLTAMFAALGAIGGLLKIPLGISSTALDSAPALIAVVFVSPALAGVAALIGHIASALYGGFPLGPFHLLIALEMLLIVFVFGRMHRANFHIGKWFFFILANGLIAPLPFYFLMSPAFFISIVPGIFIATLVNAAIGIVTLPALARVWQRKERILR